jgi:hypothetical protein
MLRKAILYISFISCFIGGFVGAIAGLWFTFSWMFDGGFDAISNILISGKHSSKDQIKDLVLYVILWSSCGLLIPTGGVIGFLLGIAPGYIGVSMTEEPTPSPYEYQTQNIRRRT